MMLSTKFEYRNTKQALITKIIMTEMGTITKIQVTITKQTSITKRVPGKSLSYLPFAKGRGPKLEPQSQVLTLTLYPSPSLRGKENAGRQLPPRSASGHVPSQDNLGTGEAAPTPGMLRLRPSSMTGTRSLPSPTGLSRGGGEMRERMSSRIRDNDKGRRAST